AIFSEGSTLNFIVFISLIIEFLKVASRVDFTNVKCKSYDLEFDDFEYCYLKAVNRSFNYMSLRVNLYKIPIAKAKVNFVLFKRMNGYRPFLYNVTVDGCRFLKNEKTNPVLGFLFGTFKKFSNINHSCPYAHDIVVHQFSNQFLNEKVTKVLPFPQGDYMVESNWYPYGILRAQVTIYFTLNNGE
ncbi:hypothetical protein KR009_005009, partial [Drosophila setifemur]